MNKLIAALALVFLTATAIAATTPNTQDWEFLNTLQIVPEGDVTFLAAAKGDAHSQYILGNSFRYSGAYPANKKLQVYWTKKAYEQGHAGAAGKLGYMYGSGYIVDRDWARGIRMLEIAADAGIVSAQFNLAQLLLQSTVATDGQRAAYWFEKAASTSNGDDNIAANAMHELAQLYSFGIYI